MKYLHMFKHVSFQTQVLSKGRITIDGNRVGPVLRHSKSSTSCWKSSPLKAGTDIS